MEQTHSNFKFWGLVIAFIFFFGITIMWTIDYSLMDEKELYEHCLPTIGKSKGTGLYRHYMYKWFGRIGVVLSIWPFFLIFFLGWLIDLYKYKEKKQEEDAIKKREQEKLVQLSKRKSWRKKQELKRRKQEQKRNKQ